MAGSSGKRSGPPSSAKKSAPKKKKRSLYFDDESGCSSDSSDDDFASTSCAAVSLSGASSLAARAAPARSPAVSSSTGVAPSAHLHTSVVTPGTATPVSTVATPPAAASALRLATVGASSSGSGAGGTGGTGGTSGAARPSRRAVEAVRFNLDQADSDGGDFSLLGGGEEEQQEEGPSGVACNFIYKLGGPVCTTCKCRVNQHRLFLADRMTFERHQKSAKVSTIQNCLSLEKEAVTNMKSVHDAAHRNQAAVLASLSDEAIAKPGSSCSRCGYSNSKYSKVSRHCSGTDPSTQCCSIHIVARDTLYHCAHGQVVPKSVVDKILEGNSPIYDLGITRESQPAVAASALDDAPPPGPSIRNAVVTSDRDGSIPAGTVNAAALSMPSLRNKVVCSSLLEVDAVLEDDYQLTQADERSHLDSQLSDMDAAHWSRHRQTFVKISEPGKHLKDVMVEPVRQQLDKYSERDDDSKLKTLIDAADEWITSGSADADVDATDTKSRGMLYELANDYEYAEDMSSSSTFTSTEAGGYKDLVQCVTRLLCFLSRQKWPKMQPHLERVNHILDELDELDDDVEDRMKMAAKLVMEAGIVPDIIVTAMLDEPELAYGVAMLEMHVAAMSLKKVGSGVVMRGGNGISRSVNVLLRLVRHALLSHSRRKAIVNKWSHDRALQYLRRAIYDYKDSSALAAICTRIRSGRAIEANTSKALKKAVDPQTGETVINGISIKQSQFRDLIPRANAEVDEALKILIPSENHRSLFCNVRNPISMDTGGTNTHVIYKNDSGAEERLYLKDVAISYDDPDAEKAVATLKTYAIFSRAYLSLGICRMSEAVSYPPISQSIIAFNSLRFQMKSNKGMRHGVDSSQLQDHYMSPSATRRVAMIELAVLPDVERTEGMSVPAMNELDKLVHDMYLRALNSQSLGGIKNNRQSLASYLNFIWPDDMQKLSISPEMAAAIHHTVRTHDESYGCDVMSRAPGGEIMNSEIIAARKQWRALGEEAASFPLLQNRAAANGPVGIQLLNLAAQRMYGPGASLRPGAQEEATLHFENANDSRHAFVHMKCGGGKNVIYSAAAIARGFDARTGDKVVIISPHNGLLAQHVAQAREHTGGLGVAVRSLESIDLQGGIPEEIDDFNLLFVSIAAWHKLMDEYEAEVNGWGIKKIVVDEYHNVLTELFRVEKSWASLENVARFQAKIMCLSATSNDYLMEILARFMGLGANYKKIGSAAEYNLPNVAVKIEREVNDSAMLEKVSGDVVAVQNQPGTHACHVITKSREQAMTMFEKLNDLGMSVDWITSEKDKDGRCDVMRRWANSEIRVLVSTIQDGIDNPKTKHVWLVGGSHCLVSAVQGVGRIRPNAQTGDDAVVKIVMSSADDESEIRRDSRDDADRAVALMKSWWEKVEGGEAFDVTKARKMYKLLFGRTGFYVWLGKPGCYLQNLFAAVNVRSENPCYICSSCLSDNDVLVAARAARRLIESQESDEDFVQRELKHIFSYCFICKDARCNGIACIQGVACLRCHGRCRDRSKCLADAKKMNTYGNCCGNCFGSYALRNVVINHQNNGACPIVQDRIKAILFYNLQKTGVSDDGVSAFQLAVPCFMSDKQWFTVMARNMREINSDRDSGKLRRIYRVSSRR